MGKEGSQFLEPVGAREESGKRRRADRRDSPMLVLSWKDLFKAIVERLKSQMQSEKPAMKWRKEKIVSVPTGTGLVLLFQPSSLLPSVRLHSTQNSRSGYTMNLRHIPANPNPINWMERPVRICEERKGGSSQIRKRTTVVSTTSPLVSSQTLATFRDYFPLPSHDDHRECTYLISKV